VYCGYAPPLVKVLSKVLLRVLVRALVRVLVLLSSAAVHAAPPVLAYSVAARYPHDPEQFTQGLELDGATLYESSGLYGRSLLTRQLLPSQPATPDKPNNATTSQPISTALPPDYFAEGLTLWHDALYLVTWREQRGFIFDRRTLQKTGEFAIQGEGWGLAHNSRQLILSNGSAQLQFLDPASFALQKSLTVTSDGVAVDKLNELEWIDQKALGPARLLANIWQSDTIVVIDPNSGRVTGRLDLSQLYPRGQRSTHADVLNGIAFDARDNTLLITGKFWPYLYRIRLLQPLP
jgi:glutaminyl-peptide cyclotransferase